MSIKKLTKSTKRKLRKNNRTKHLLTVVVCCYNQERFIGDCLVSLFQQQNRGFFEVIIVDDGSTDATLDRIREYSRGMPHCRIIYTKNNQGLVYSCNKALQKIHTPYFVRLDADDYLTQDAMEVIAQALRIVKKDFYVFSRYDVIGKKKRKISVTSDMYTWVAGGVVFKTDRVKKLGGYSNEFWEEYDLYLKLLTAGATFKHFQKPIYCYRRSPQSMTSNTKNKHEGLIRLKKKWGEETLQQYGDYKRIIRYYQQRGV